ncbi:MAG: hypothetical protein AAF203_04875 [Pseudomonadota bacterium]
MRGIKAIVLLSLGLLLSNCSTLPDPINQDTFSGVYNCPGQMQGRQKWNPYTTVITQKWSGATPMVVVETFGLAADTQEKRRQNVYIMDGEWHFVSHYRNDKMYPLQVKAQFLGKNQIQWEARHPAMPNHKGAPGKAGHVKGTWWINSQGHMVSSGSYFDGELTCQRVNNNWTQHLYRFKNLK